MMTEEKGKEKRNNTEPGIPQSETVGPLAPLKVGNFRLLLTGTVLSNAAQWIQQITINWIVYKITGSGTALGTINLVRSVSAVGMIPAAGVIIDRFNRRRIMMTTNAWLFLITLILGIILLFDQSHIAALFIFSFLAGLAGTVDANVRQVIVFDIVPRAATPNAVALIQTGWSLMRSFGPGIGGFLILWLGPGGNFLVQAAAYALITITIMQIQFPAKKYTSGRSSAFQNIREGLRYVAGARTTRTFMLMGFILPMFIIPVFSILPPIYAVKVFHGGPDTLGLLLSAIGVGGIAGGVVVTLMGKFERRGLIQLGSLFLMSISLIGFALSTTLIAALGMMVIAGFFEMLFLTTNQTLLQLSIPDELRGRVTSVVNLNAAINPLGGLIAGIGSDLLGGPKGITIVLVSIAAAIAVAVFIFSPTIRNYRLSQAISTDAAPKP
jgi:MFS transporter, DHA1 family, staphyloferrin A biosynthesis exporter